MQKRKFAQQEEVLTDSNRPEIIYVGPKQHPVVSSYSRAEALADGTLKDAGWMAVEAGFKYPVALTRAAWAKCVTVPDYSLSETEEGRLWDVLMVLRWLAKGTTTDELRFDVFVSNRHYGLEEVPLRSVFGPGDDGSPVLTVMLRSES